MRGRLDDAEIWSQQTFYFSVPTHHTLSPWRAEDMKKIVLWGRAIDPFSFLTFLSIGEAMSGTDSIRDSESNLSQLEARCGVTGWKQPRAFRPSGTTLPAQVLNPVGKRRGFSAPLDLQSPGRHLLLLCRRLDAAR